LNEDITLEVFSKNLKGKRKRGKINVKLGTPDCERCRAEESCNIGEVARRSLVARRQIQLNSLVVRKKFYAS
jgi:hypothetical protein